MKFDLNHLMDLAGKLDYKPDCQIHRDNLAGYLTSDRAIAIAEALRALEQRAEAAEAKLAALAKQEPVHFRLFGTDGETYVKCSPDHIDAMAFWQHPAPAADLAALVPAEKPVTHDKLLCDNIENNGWNLCRAAILRKIEEAKK